MIGREDDPGLKDVVFNVESSSNPQIWEIVVSHGPVLIFDKSALQGLSIDESVWLDNFFRTNITPLFFVETLADLEKKIHSGRHPEEVVGNLAYKTPDQHSQANTHHSQLLIRDLIGSERIRVDKGVPTISGGQPVVLNGQKGLIFKEGPEEEALRRWQLREFLDIERQTAKFWRQELSKMNFEGIYSAIRRWFPKKGTPKTLIQVKSLADILIDESDQRGTLNFAFFLLGLPQQIQQRAFVRWESSGRPRIRDFSPYFRHVFSIDLFFYIALAADLISRARPSNKIDIAYLYYLPFCKVFTSSDHLHAKVVPLFLQSNQTFVDGRALKDDLAKLNEYYSSLPESITKLGLSEFAAYPPTDQPFLVTQLWDKHIPNWRAEQAEPKIKLTKDLQDALMKLANRFKNEGTPVNPAIGVTQKEIAALTIERKVFAKKGRWNRFPPKIMEKQGAGSPHSEPKT